MKFIKIGITITAIILFSGFSTTTIEPEFISIENLSSTSQLSVTITGKGGHTGSCINFEIKNLTADSLKVWIEPGRRLVSVDSGLQDIFIVKEQLILLASNETKNLSGFGFCCQSSNGGPRKDSKFTLGYMAPKEWVELAEVINENDFQISAIQSAVWSLSNNHQTASITGNPPESVRLLRETVAKIKNESIPWYYLTYEKDTSQVFSGKPKHLSGSFNYELTSNTVVTISITTEKGKLQKVLSTEIPKQKGKYELVLNQTVKGWKKGKYFIRIYEGNHSLNKKMEFEL